MAMIGEIIADQYKIERSLNKSGGTASIFLAVDIKSKIKVAIKFAKSSRQGLMHEDTLLDREAELLSRWSWRHPGVVHIFPVSLVYQRDASSIGRTAYVINAIGLAENPRCMVMEYLAGGSLAEKMDKVVNFPLMWKLELFYQILIIVAHIHRLGYGHRDLKPDNIMFRNQISPTDVPEPVLVDFALASNGSDATKIAEASHTLGYAAPERLLSRMGFGYDRLSNYPLEADIWSLGVMLYEILTGDTLFQGEEEKIRTTIIDGVFNINVPAKGVVTPVLAHQLANLIRRMLAPNPSQRPNIKMLIYAIEELFPPPRVAR